MLHVRHLPDFDGKLNGRTVELLIQYLTAPYMRIPLVLRLLCDEARVKALGVPELQNVLDSVLFEPGQWMPPLAQGQDQLPTPSTVPAPTRDHLSTPTGYLFNEIVRAPQVNSLID